MTHHDNGTNKKNLGPEAEMIQELYTTSNTPKQNHQKISFTWSTNDNKVLQGKFFLLKGEITTTVHDP